MASRDWINPSAWPYSCSCTADLIIESDVQQSENDPTASGTAVGRSCAVVRFGVSQRDRDGARSHVVVLCRIILMSLSTESSLKVSPRLRELVAAYDKKPQRTLYGEGEIIVN